MKQYFCKYIPVEGKIKKNDKLIDPTLDSLGVMEALTDNEGVNIKARGGSKVELSLCSRDVSLHEECWLDNEKVIPNQLHVDLRDKCYKVIGSISPDATWVNENDEFDDGDISIWAWDGKEGWLAEHPIGNYKDYRIKIKGPCGHFH
jgi:hypothetical protein